MMETLSEKGDSVLFAIYIYTGGDSVLVNKKDGGGGFCPEGGGGGLQVKPFIRISFLWLSWMIVF